LVAAVVICALAAVGFLIGVIVLAVKDRSPKQCHIGGALLATCMCGDTSCSKGSDPYFTCQSSAAGPVCLTCPTTDMSSC